MGTVMAKHFSVPIVATLAAIAWGWTLLVVVLLLLEPFSMGLRKGWSVVLSALPSMLFFICVPLIAFAASLVLAILMWRGDMRDRPAAITLLVIGILWALAQTFAVLIGL
jgi:hypothetical protein